MAGSNWEADKMLDVYIHDYLMKRNLHQSAKAFLTEGKVSSDPVAIDAPGGFLFEWWSVFWDIFIARTNEKHSEVAASYIETQQLKARDQQQQQHQQQQQQQHQQQQQQQQQQHQQQQQQQHQQQQVQLQQMQQMQLIQRHAAQRQRQDGHLGLNGTANGLGADALLRQPGTANAMATKIYEERLKHPHQRDTLDDTSMKRYGDVNQILDVNQISNIKGAAPLGQSSRPLLHSAPGTPAALQQVQSRSQQLSGSSQDVKNDVALLNQRSPVPENNVFGVPGVGHSKTNLLSPGGQGGNSVKGWPLAIDTLRASQGVVPSPKSFLQGPPQYHQYQMLTQEQQRQLVLQAQTQSGSPLSSLQDMDNRRLRALLGRTTMNAKDGHSNTGSDVSGGVGSPMQAASPAPRGSQDQQEIFMKIHAQIHAQQQQQPSSSLQQQQQQQQQQPATPQQQQQDRLVGVAGVSVDGNSFRSNDQNSSKGPNAQRKRKQHPASSSGPANSTGTANTTGPSPNSAPSTPSTHTPGDVMSMTLQHSSTMSKPGIMMYGSDGNAPLASPSNQLADMDRFADDGSLDDNVESFLSHEEADPREPLFGAPGKRSQAGHTMDVSQGFSFKEVGCLHASTTKVVCCHFSSDGKVLASAGHDKKVNLWNMDTLKLNSTLEDHSNLITDVRFSPNSARLATSSFDKTVRVWDADNPSYPLRTFPGHSTSVMSLDFHPVNEDLLCSCDGDGEIRYWSVSQAVCTKIFKGGVTQMRFQPRVGRLLAAAAENIVSIFDVETEACVHSLERHTKPVHSVCWDVNGDYVASVSEDSVRVWALGANNDGECVHELNCNGNKFHSCVFHPNYPSLLVIGCYQSLELWNMVENKSMTVPAHEGLIAALAQSTATGMVASASHDKCVKLWT